VSAEHKDWDYLVQCANYGHDIMSLDRQAMNASILWARSRVDVYTDLKVWLEKQQQSYDKGQMMSLSESVQGAIVVRRIRAKIAELEEA